jgi:hypothetical protein
LVPNIIYIVLKLVILKKYKIHGAHGEKKYK